MSKIEKLAKKVELSKLLSLLKVEDLAQESGYYKRSAKKITASGLVQGFWCMYQKGKNSLRSWSIHTGRATGHAIRKQSLSERLGKPAVDLSKRFLIERLNTRIKRGWLTRHKQDLGKGVLSHFNRILIQDSTVQSLPKGLYSHFGGNHSPQGVECALMRIQATFEFLSQNWLDFSVDKYSQNDQSQAKWGLDKLEKRDLLIRDLGYFTLDALEQLIKNQYVITSLLPNVSVLDLEGTPYNILELVRGKDEVDMDVLVGATKKLKMRLVARKLTKKEKNKRIKQAKKKAHATCKYSEEYYELLGYEIYLTNIEKEKVEGKKIAQLYGLRWYIEIQFKAWKSFFNFKKFFKQNEMSYERALISIYLILTLLVYVQNDLYPYIRQKVEAGGQKTLSILKVFDVVNDFFEDLINITQIREVDKWIPHFEANAIYEKRKKRQNMIEKLESLFDS